MSILSKLFGGDKNAEKEVLNLLNGLFANQQPAQTAAPKAEAPAKTTPSPEPVRNDEPSGFSWGSVMPAEENQYNYGGTYEQYFEHVFAEDFPAYRYEKSYNNDYGNQRVIYTFFSGVTKALVLELMPEASEAVKLRNVCRAAGIPYLRFYYDHDGWWNTRAYVVSRMRNALNG